MKRMLTKSIIMLCLFWITFVYAVIQPVLAAEIINTTEFKKCALKKAKPPIVTSTGKTYILKDRKWQLQR